MVSSQKIWVLAVAGLMAAGGAACGALDPEGALEAAPAPEAEQALRPSDASSVLLLSGEEVAAMELAKFAQHRVTDGNFLRHVQDQQLRHKALLQRLSKVAAQEHWQVSTVMSQSGTQQWSALLQKGGAEFARMYLRLQAPWQKHVVNQLAHLEQSASSAPLRALATDLRAAWELDMQSGTALDHP